MVNTTAAMVSGGRSSGVLPLASLNHISIVCRSVEESLDFYMNVLGFIPVRRPGSFNFDGAWLFNYGIGIHLLQSEDPENLPEKTEINPKDNHISFQDRIWFLQFPLLLEENHVVDGVPKMDRHGEMERKATFNGSLGKHAYALSLARTRNLVGHLRSATEARGKRKFLLCSWKGHAYFCRTGHGCHVGTCAYQPAAVREHGGGGAAAQGAGHHVHQAVRGGGRHLRGPDLLPRPRRLHDRDLQLRQPPRRPARRPDLRHGWLQEGRRRKATTSQAAVVVDADGTGSSCSSGDGDGGAVRAIGDAARRRRGGAHLVRVSVRWEMGRVSDLARPPAPAVR